MPTKYQSGKFTKGSAKRIARIVHRGMRRPDLPATKVPAKRATAPGGGFYALLTSNMTAYESAGTLILGQATGTLHYGLIGSGGSQVTLTPLSYPDVHIYNLTGATPSSGEMIAIFQTGNIWLAVVGSC
jgi:hypothetical protein